MTYTIEELKSFDDAVKDKELIAFFHAAGCKLSSEHEWLFNWENFPFKRYIESAASRFMVCRRDGKPVGFHLSHRFNPLLDPTLIFTYQDLLYAIPGTRASKLLMDDFIDFGKKNSHHIITTIGPKTNIKRKTLIKLGFTPMETVFRMGCHGAK